MGLSETIVAAAIGALATVTTALFQLVGAFRTRAKVDARPKRGTTTRSILAILALMIASAAGGFLYSEFIKQRSGDDISAMRQQLKELTALLAQAAADRARANAAVSSQPQAEAAAVRSEVATLAAATAAESIAYVPACRRGDIAAACEENDAQRIALCATVPAQAQVQRIDLFAQPDAVQHPWDQHRAAFEQDLGGARFTGKFSEYAQSDGLKAVCVNFMHWSSEHPHMARVLVQYALGPPAPVLVPVSTPPEAAPAQVPAVIAADSLPALSNTASLTAPAAVR
jgi:hypothetical protein